MIFRNFDIETLFDIEKITFWALVLQFPQYV